MSIRRKLKKNKLPVLVASVAILLFVALVLIFLGIYKFNWNNAFTSAFTKTVPLPAVYIKGAGLISIGEIQQDSKSVKKFYESQDFDQLGMRVDFSTDQGNKRLQIKEKEIINKLIENKIIEALARKRSIILTDADVDREVNSSIEQFGNRQNLMSELARLYGWSLEDFKQKVVKPELYTEKLAEVHASEADLSEQEKKIKTLHERAALGKEDFADTASSSSEGESSKNGGDLGWSAREQLIPEIAEVAYNLEVGKVSDVIASPLGFHIIKVEEKKTEGSEELIHLRQIFVKIPTFGDWLKEQIKDYKIVVLLEDYQWNANEVQIEFKDQSLRQFEENLEANSPGDPSVLP